METAVKSEDRHGTVMKGMERKLGVLREHTSGPQLGLGGQGGPPRQRDTERQRETETEAKLGD